VKRRVLVIEDNPDAALTLRDLLELDGHEAYMACSGAEGLELAQRFVPDVIFCDIGLPGMSGYEVAAAVRGSPSLKCCVLVALSGHALPDDINQANAAGFDLHLAKPASLPQLLGALAQPPATHGEHAPQAR
jgi:CheY-like chemotaxis protein